MATRRRGIALANGWHYLEERPSTVMFPGGDQVNRSFSALHDGMRISSTGAYHGFIERKISFDGAGRILRQ